jgi:alpha-N-acetylglucosaminidase
MRGFLLSLICLVGLVSLGDAAGNTSTAALEALVQRQLPFHRDQFVFELEPQVKVNMKTHSALDVFTLSDGSDGKIHIECSTISACARGLYTYLSLLDCAYL